MKKKRAKKRRLFTKQKKQITISVEKIQALIDRVGMSNLSDEDKDFIRIAIEMLEDLNIAIDEKRLQLKILKDALYGNQSETSEKTLKNPPVQEKKKTRKKRESGKNGADAYKGAKHISISHPELKPGDLCPMCLKGKVCRRKKPSRLIRITGNTPLSATVYECEYLRCSLCEAFFKAEPPDDIAPDKYDERSKAMIVILKYGSGFPFYRLEKLQDMFEVPMSDSTQWDRVKEVARPCTNIFEELICRSALANLYYADDTGVKILNPGSRLLDTKNKESPKRKGLYTSAILCEVGDVKIALYFSGNRYAGENLDGVLGKRPDNLEKPLCMSDGSSNNEPKDAEIIDVKCNVHARRYFVKLIHLFPDECTYVIKALAEVYKNDKVTKDRNMTPRGRLLYHKEHSTEIMDDLKSYLENLFSDKKVEPNSSLGKAIKYMLKRWEKLTRFLHIEGVPLDNNICEQMIKRAVLHRKNSMFYKTRYGAYVGDMMMSIIHTCYLNRINPFNYLVALQENEERVAANPSDWLPWNYESNLPAKPIDLQMAPQ
ncbi:MAG: IS66 family transposase [Eudoraea sp.]|nr:IS66 family transposase [Eudoraea sp.]